MGVSYIGSRDPVKTNLHFMLNVIVDVGPLLELDQKLGGSLGAMADDARLKLIAMTEAHIKEQARLKLHSRLSMFEDALSTMQVSEDTWVINLDAKARWIDDGLPPGSMLDGLLGSPKAKTAKDGSKYIVVPFKHNKGPTQQTPGATMLTNAIKAELKSRKIPYGKVEAGPTGPKLGLLHSIDITNAPIRTHPGPGQGKGPVGKPMQGPTGIPLLQGIRIYQRPDTTTKSGVRKDIMTFRVASSKHRAQGRWEHPGLDGTHLLEEGAAWALRTWEQELLPALLERFKTTV